MREILFRGKRVDNGEWVYGGFSHFYPYTCPLHDLDSLIIDGNPEGPYKVIPDSVGMYSGLQDKNGVRIFDGDILFTDIYATQELFVVDFGPCGVINDAPLSQGYVGFYIKPINPVEDGFRDDILYLLDYGAVVIGNIHDNKELLGSSQNLS